MVLPPDGTHLRLIVNRAHVEGREGPVSSTPYGIAQVGDAAAGDDNRIVEPVRCTGQVGEVGDSFPRQHRDKADGHLVDQTQIQGLGGDAGDGDVLVPAICLARQELIGDHRQHPARGVLAGCPPERIAAFS